MCIKNRELRVISSSYGGDGHQYIEFAAHGIVDCMENSAIPEGTLILDTNLFGLEACVLFTNIFTSHLAQRMLETS